MESIDEFDVDISKLWKWKKEILINDENGEILFKGYLRIPGDADVNRARVASLRESAKLRAMLKDKDNFDRYAYILPVELIEENLLDYVLGLSLREYLSNIDKEIDLPIPAKPDEDAPTEEHEKYQIKVDNWAKERLAKINELAEKERNKLEQKLSKLSLEELYKIYEEKAINLFCDSLVAEVFTDYCIFYGLYKDGQFKKRFFENFEDFDNLPTWVKDRLRLEYSNLSLNYEELKK